MIVLAILGSDNVKNGQEETAPNTPTHSAPQSIDLLGKKILGFCGLGVPRCYGAALHPHCPRPGWPRATS